MDELENIEPLDFPKPSGPPEAAQSFFFFLENSIPLPINQATIKDLPEVGDCCTIMFFLLKSCSHLRLLIPGQKSPGSENVAPAPKHSLHVKGTAALVNQYYQEV